MINQFNKILFHCVLISYKNNFRKIKKMAKIHEKKRSFFDVFCKTRKLYICKQKQKSDLFGSPFVTVFTLGKSDII